MKTTCFKRLKIPSVPKHEQRFFSIKIYDEITTNLERIKLGPLTRDALGFMKRNMKCKMKKDYRHESDENTKVIQFYEKEHEMETVKGLQT